MRKVVCVKIFKKSYLYSDEVFKFKWVGVGYLDGKILVVVDHLFDINVLVGWVIMEFVRKWRLGMRRREVLVYNGLF